MAEPIGLCGITTSYVQENGDFFRCELILTLPEGWKLPKAPDISVIESQNLKDFEYNGNFERLTETTVKIRFSIRMIDTLIQRNTLKLQIDCPLCRDICTISSQKICMTLINKEISPFSKIFMLLLGFLGGLLLNIMPCVLPVILMKLKSFRSKEAIYGSIAGNYASFSVFCAVIAFFKISGEAVGWGLHFQNPYFLEAIAVILFCLILYSFEIITWFPTIMVSNRKYRVFFGNFMSNVTACLIAIPCTAPFLGTAAAFAIQGTLGDLCLIFFAIATGFSTPYFLATLIPANAFVKYASYGNVFKKVTNCGVIIAFLWFFWLLTHHLSQMAAVLYGAAFLTLAALLQKKKYFAAGIVLLLCFCGWVQREFADFSVKIVDPYENIHDQLKEELTKGHVVIFNITADWCLTCKYNGRVFRSNKVSKYLKDNEVKFIEADMTRKNNSLQRFINDHNRVGIPFTIIYGPRAPNSGILLEEILTEDSVIEAIKKVM
jgi:suppressor for copper-sensitivity B